MSDTLDLQAATNEATRSLELLGFSPEGITKFLDGLTPLQTAFTPMLAEVLLERRYQYIYPLQENLTEAVETGHRNYLNELNSDIGRLTIEQMHSLLKIFSYERFSYTKPIAETTYPHMEALIANHSSQKDILTTELATRLINTSDFNKFVTYIAKIRIEALLICENGSCRHGQVNGLQLPTSDYNSSAAYYSNPAAVMALLSIPVTSLALCAYVLLAGRAESLGRMGRHVMNSARTGFGLFSKPVVVEGLQDHTNDTGVTLIQIKKTN